ncbi:MAG: thioredoxin family protein, partial [Chitinophagaceae bacterium]|nr:thioredoxin family protein [Chitinophagaceae bacterium]
MRKVILIPGLIIASALAVFSFKPKDKVVALETSQENAAGIQFIEEDWKKALQQAKEQSKLIFLDAYTSWCGPCKLLKRNTFPD